MMRRGLGRELNVLDVLLEGISFIIRASLLRILQEKVAQRQNLTLAVLV